MSKIVHNQKGFGTIEALLVLVIVVLIGVVGFLVYKNDHKTTKAADAASVSTNTSTPPKSPATKPATAAVNPLIYQDSIGKTYEIDLEARTADQKGIAAALNSSCNGSSAKSSDKFVAVTGLPDLFTTTTNNFRIDGNFAAVNTGCYDKTKGGAPEVGGAIFYLRKVDGQWKLITVSQGQLNCKDWDGIGVPASFAGSCYDDATGTTRAPKP